MSRLRGRCSTKRGSQMAFAEPWPLQPVRASSLNALGTLLGAAAVSMATASVVAQLRSFRISEVGGYFYWFVVSPMAGALVGWVTYLGLRSLVSGWRLVGGGILVVGILGVIGHTWALDHGKIGGEFVYPRGFDPEHESSEALLHALDDHNQAVAGRAWVELQARAERDHQLMWRAVELFRTTEPTAYIDSYRTLDAVAFLARRGDRRVVPILLEILGSQETSLVTPPGGPSRIAHHNRVFAEELLSRHFGISVGQNAVESQEPKTASPRLPPR